MLLPLILLCLSVDTVHYTQTQGNMQRMSNLVFFHTLDHKSSSTIQYYGYERWFLAPQDGAPPVNTEKPSKGSVRFNKEYNRHCPESRPDHAFYLKPLAKPKGNVGIPARP